LDENVKVRTVVCKDQFLTVRRIAEELDVNRNAIQLVLMKNLGMKNVCMKILAKNPTNDQLQQTGNFLLIFAANC
jgi:hypothetical protein